MATCSLTLHPYGNQPFSVGLSENDGRRGSIEQIITKTTDVCIFSDLSYEFALSCGETSPVREVDVYIIEYNLGVSAQKTYQIKRIDSDYFSNDSQ